MSPTLKTTREQRDAWYKEATAAQTQRNPMPARICDLIEDIDRLLALHDPAEGSKGRNPLRHAIAQEGKDGRPDTSGRWATLCEGVETPNPNIETAKNSYDVIDVETGNVLAGYIPKPELRLVREWISLHQNELVQAWARARRGESVRKIRPLK